MNAEKDYTFDKVTLTTVVSVYRLNQAKLFSSRMTVSIVVQVKLFSVSISVQAQLSLSSQAIQISCFVQTKQCSVSVSVVLVSVSEVYQLQL